jgi:hypothetical protein
MAIEPVLDRRVVTWSECRRLIRRGIAKILLTAGLLFPSRTGNWQLSNAGGEQPRWRSDGKELFYLAPDGKIMATPVTIGSNFDAGTPIGLFQANPREMVATSEQFSYVVSRDGQKFLINTQLKTDLTPMSIVLNWTAKLGK